MDKPTPLIDIYLPDIDTIKFGLPKNVDEMGADDLYYYAIRKVSRIAANHAAKQIVEWLENECDNEEHLIGEPRPRRLDCRQCWQSLKALVEGKK